ncbi:MAG: non-canonical purine NTP pyrophosphatase [Candidatus Nealsonbacteria bacterium CG_4_9_14_0_2_um_filter_37_38]|uniref:Non-canonical purine NTP pyrophosphatase n=1 Tax=Candidatus Nealsonbacteria bacterium CG_4_10_14_0_8_um_filter_37_14 TaxID=1974684 RepID=A0A2M7R5K5_9BACT|nr:MAG: non-canonical purine NTP pyrophosphatase [Candidatus Nealsonbacteria bacterium CG11_big_fil_rev_8_21_14_0_20_37_68]PIW92126.1 MAG: non-canonical purine NTP pyrophosphatase [Candidatus Nealsonbacteria bacterium CG_4_8_14_3_um_filter_37_23]PIY88576.1 MAG: non-canonical purine NTP pyrophosphatase [Candidatus Nealsonbacteria bacterium CG_4_10_14_0_8_um_filter_37_14]PJC51439.1 MAG: non-canonical purine NTP pyrophosphatase [Candidatus Nealsonbacteria bacterium CG_4_9_14_0_2_um_filter_37_38]
MRKLLIATTNPGKIREYKEIFNRLKLPVKLVSLKDLKIKEKVKEDGETFEENAVKKAKFYYKLTKLPTLAEDSGLEIDYLNGQPGVKSRRWPGYEASDKELINITLKKLKGVTLEKRGAQLRVVMALIIDEKVKTFQGLLRGIIMEKPIKKMIPGYPFRSLFYLPEIKKVIGELTMEQEAMVAHRKKAVKKALPILKKIFNLNLRS